MKVVCYASNFEKVEGHIGFGLLEEGMKVGCHKTE